MTAERASGPDIVRAWAAVDDIRAERGPVVEALDVQRILSAASFERVEDRWTYTWRLARHALVFQVHKDSTIVPTGEAKWLVRKVVELDLLPRRPDDAG